MEAKGKAVIFKEAAPNGGEVEATRGKNKNTVTKSKECVENDGIGSTYCN